MQGTGIFTREDDLNERERSVLAWGIMPFFGWKRERLGR